MMPNHIQQEYEKLSPAQKQKFNHLLSWSTSSGIPGVAVPVMAYEKILDMVKQMGEEPATPVEPDRTVNHDWNFIPTQRKNS